MAETTVCPVRMLPQRRGFSIPHLADYYDIRLNRSDATTSLLLCHKLHYQTVWTMYEPHCSQSFRLHTKQDNQEPDSIV